MFQIQPFDILNIPINYCEIVRILDNAVYLIEKENIYFEFESRKKIYHVLYKEIEYFYSDKRKIVIKTQNNKHEFYGKLDAVLSDLPHNFTRVHQSCIINQDYISEYTYDLIKMRDNTVISVSQSNRKLVRKQVMMHQLARKHKHV